jgi:hypothetical protein
MADAVYDPRDLANMFRTIEAQSGGGGGGFLSDHPSPKDRYARLNQEAQYLRVRETRRDDRQFASIKEKLRSMPRAQSMAEIQRNGQRNPSEGNNYPRNVPLGRVEYPSSRFRTYTELGVVRIDVPDNWRELADQGSVWFAPEGGYGSSGNGQAVFTHGINLGVVQTQSRNLQQATNEFVNQLQQGNGNLRSRSGYQRTSIDGRNALTISLSNTNEATGRPEVINLVTTQLRNGELFFLIGVSPQSEWGTYQGTFQTILRSVRLSN